MVDLYIYVPLFTGSCEILQTMDVDKLPNVHAG